MTTRGTAFLTVMCAAAVAAARRPVLHPLSDAYIDHINSIQDSWKAGRNFPEDTPMELLKNMNGVRMDDEKIALPMKTYGAELIASLPESFDPRDKWPNCPSLDEIRDQGACGSCWAFGAVEAMTDRYCIHSNGTKQFHFSAEDMLTCSSAGGCQGGNPASAWDYWNSDGIVSGGNYGSGEGCRTYSIHPCIHHGHEEDGLKNCTKTGPTPECIQKCDSKYNVSYKQDLQKGNEAYTIRGESDLMAELYLHGPVEGMFAVFEDFLSYKSGVYKHVGGELISGHAIKIMGWGVENGLKYWLIANSWNTHFGEKGFFKMLRGENECDIESIAVAGIPN